MRIRLATAEDYEALASIFSEYLHYLAGIRESIDTSADLDRTWFEKPGQLFPFLIEDPEPVGFALVTGRLYAEASGHDVDWHLHDFAIRESERGRGLGRQLAQHVFNEFTGSWSLGVLEGNDAALDFWRRLIGQYEEGRDDDGPVLNFHCER